MTQQEKDELARRLQKIDGNISRIFNMLESDHKTNQAGLVESVSKLKHEVETLTIKEKLLMARATTYGAVASALVVFIGWIVKMVFNHLIK